MAVTLSQALNALTSTDTLDTVVGVEGATAKKTDVDNLGGGGGYLKYVALLTQTGTDDPEATVLENTLGGTVVWTRDDAGIYLGTLAGAFTANKSTCLSMFNGDLSATYFATYEFIGEDQISIRCINGSFSAVDVLGCTIEIRVYP